MFEGLQKAILLKTVRFIAASAGVAIAALVFSHTTILGYVMQACQALSSPEAFATGFAGLAVAGASYVFSIRDATTVNAKVITAAATASISAANDPTIRADTMAAIKTGTLVPPDGHDELVRQSVAARRASGMKGG